MKALPALLLFVLLGHAARQDSFRISVDVDLVVLHATVTDRQGGFVSDLNEQAFEVYENGVPQPIRLFESEDVPVTVGLVVDHSSTMGPKIGEVSIAARTFARASNPQDEMFVVNFNEKVSLGLPAKLRFTNSVAQLQMAIGNANAGGQTALYDGIAKALEELEAGSRDKKVLIVISDGGDNRSARNLDQVMRLASQSSAVIYTVGLFDENDPDRNPGVLKRLARATGGEAFLPSEASEVVAICERIARDIRHQYTIGYVPLNLAHDGVYRAVRVVARAKGHDKLSVRTRAGYIRGGEPRLAETSAK
ncbi:MAG TPA: VWA domain-containing protein [Bryobacteraceae bacterium]|nr:VWA domain-containing protein [Bryobacteraceae bacterium]